MEDFPPIKKGERESFTFLFFIYFAVKCKAQKPCGYLGSQRLMLGQGKQKGRMVYKGNTFP